MDYRICLLQSDNKTKTINENIQNISNCKRMSNYISVAKMNNLGLYNISVKVYIQTLSITEPLILHS